MGIHVTHVYMLHCGPWFHDLRISVLLEFCVIHETMVGSEWHTGTHVVSLQYFVIHEIRLSQTSEC